MPKDKDEFYDDDMMKYKKKAPRKPVPKSDHKHIYISVLVESLNNDRLFLYLGKRCKICGKTKYDKMFTEKDEKTGFYRLLSNDEVLKKYANLPKVKEIKFEVFEDIPGEKYDSDERDDMLDE